MAKRKKSKKILSIPIHHNIVEDETTLNLFTKNKVPLRFVLQGIKKASETKSYDVILIKIDRLYDMGWSVIQSLRRSLESLKTDSNLLIVHMDSASLKEYYLASIADEIILTPSGTLDLTGFQAEVYFIKKGMEQLGLGADFVKTGDYKTFADMFIRDSMSKPHKEMIEAIVDRYLKEVSGEIQDSRSQLTQPFQEILDEGPFTADESMESHLIDHLLYATEIDNYLEERLDVKKCVQVPLKLYDSLSSWKNFYRPSKKIAIIYASGNIVDAAKSNPSSKTAITPKQMIKAIERARDDKKVKAIIIKVNSPGGSALASDMIWHEIKKAKEEKPIVVSMGNMAASGGYYLSVGADYIFAEGMTLTGSIGVIAGKIYGGLLLDKLGIHREVITRGKHADMNSISSPFTKDERHKLEEQIDSFYYRQFLEKAAEGRSKDVSSMGKLAQGRVWTGWDGQEHGLVDAIGGLMEAIDESRKRANIRDHDKVKFLVLPKKKLRLSLRSLVQSRLSPVSNEILSLMDWQSLFGRSKALYLMPYIFKID
ncbi:MAG TPA: signal peptide peptidase SppA [Spirochaetes bacterium]|nr:signal peptide peptidase SppA [Spirochaetota bacterium]